MGNSYCLKWGLSISKIEEGHNSDFLLFKTTIIKPISFSSLYTSAENINSPTFHFKKVLVRECDRDFQREEKETG